MREHYSEPSSTKPYLMPVMKMKTFLKNLFKLGKKLYDGLVKVLVSLLLGFVDVCDLAGLNYQQVRSFARKLINDPNNTEFQRKRLNVLLNMTHKEEAK